MEDIALTGAAGVLIVVAGAYVATKIGIAAPILLVVVGAIGGYLPGTPALEIDPDLILVLVLPPILYAAALTVPATDFRRNFRGIAALAVVLVVVSAAVGAVLIHWLMPDLSWAAAIALGAVVSPPDAVAATAMGKKLGLPERLVTLLEGEGLVNDATALVLLRSAVAAAATTVTFWEVVGDFALAVVVAAGIGVVVGIIGVWVRSRLDDPVLTTAVSLTVPFIAFVPAEHAHGSGVLAVVVAGLLTGHQAAQHFSARDRVSERVNWRTIQLLLENGVFLIMGYQMPVLIDDVSDGGGPGVAETIAIALGVVACLIALRMLFMPPLLLWLSAHDRRAREADTDAVPLERLGPREGIVLGWAGMRGVVTVAAAQTLPSDFTHRPQLVLIAFVVAVVTLIGQGTTLPFVIRKLKVSGTDTDAERRELKELIAEMADAMATQLQSPDLRDDDGKPFDPELLAKFRDERGKLAIRMTAVGEAPHAASDERRALLRILLDAGQASLLDARAANSYSTRTIKRAQTILDTEMLRVEMGPLAP